MKNWLRKVGVTNAACKLCGRDKTVEQFYWRCPSAKTLLDVTLCFVLTNFDEFRAVAVSHLIDGHLILFTIFVISFTIRSLKGSNCEQFPCDFYSIENNRLK